MNKYTTLKIRYHANYFKYNPYFLFNIKDIFKRSLEKREISDFEPFLLLKGFGFFWDEKLKNPKIVVKNQIFFEISISFFLSINKIHINRQLFYEFVEDEMKFIIQSNWKNPISVGQFSFNFFIKISSSLKELRLSTFKFFSNEQFSFYSK